MEATLPPTCPTSVFNPILTLQPARKYAAQAWNAMNRGIKRNLLNDVSCSPFLFQDAFNSLYSLNAASGFCPSWTTAFTAWIMATGCSAWKMFRPISTPNAP